MLVDFFIVTQYCFDHHPSFWFCGPGSIDSIAQLNGKSGERFHTPWSLVLFRVASKINVEEPDKKSRVVSYCLPLR